MSVDLASLVDIDQAIDRALGFFSNASYDRFIADQKMMWAIYSQVIVIGEATSRISREFRDHHPEIAWSEMLGMRHRLVHGYDAIKWDRVWDTVIHDLPKLKAAIAPLIPKEP